MADREQTFNAAVNLTERAVELVDQLGDRPLALRNLRRALAELRSEGDPRHGQDVPVFLMRMALVLLDRRGERDAACHLQMAIDTFLRTPRMKPGDELDEETIAAFLEDRLN